MYVKTTSDIKRVILRLMEIPIKQMGMSSSDLLTFIKKSPEGSETLVRPYVLSYTLTVVSVGSLVATNCRQSVERRKSRKNPLLCGKYTVKVETLAWKNFY